MSEFFGDGSRFTGAADNVRRQVQCPLHAQQPIPHGLFRLDGEPQNVLGRVHVAVMDGLLLADRRTRHARRGRSGPYAMPSSTTGVVARPCAPPKEKNR